MYQLGSQEWDRVVNQDRQNRKTETDSQMAKQFAAT